MLQSKDIRWLNGYKARPTYVLQETLFRSKDIHRLKVTGWKMVFYTNGKEKKARASDVYTYQNKLYFILQREENI